MSFTDNEINQIIEAFLDMTTERQYIGARYVPLFGRKDEESIEWDNTGEYEPLTIVLYQGNSYTSRQYVPVGVDITNLTYWANTGNYNAQVEAYRREAIAIANKIPENEFDEEHTVKDYIDAVSDIIPANEFDEEHTVKDYIDSLKDATKVFQSYLGRLYKSVALHGGSNPQGMCMVDEQNAIAFITNSSSTNIARAFFVNVHTGVVSNEIETEYGHCNGIAYKSDTDEVWICPNYDYLNSQALINKIYVCDRATLVKKREIEFDFEPHSIAIDKVTNEIWITKEEFSPYKVSLYKFNADDETNPTYIGIIPTSIGDNVNIHGRISGSLGAQNITAYNGELYYLIGGYVNCLLNLDKENASIKNVVNIDSQCFIYTCAEAESVDFTPNGTMILFANSRIITTDLFATFSALTFTGKTIESIINDKFGVSNPVECIVDGSNDVNYNIYQNGLTAYPFATFMEALCAAQYRKCPVKIKNTVEVNSAISDFSEAWTIDIRGVDANSKLVFTKRYYFNTDVHFEGNSAANLLKIERKADGDTLFEYPWVFYKNAYIKRCQFVSANLQHYAMRLNGMGLFDTVSFSDTTNLYTNQIDGQSRGMAVIVNSAGVGIGSSGTFAEPLT